MSISLYMVVFTDPNGDLAEKVNQEYKDCSHLLNDVCAVIYSKEISSISQVQQRLGISKDGTSGIVVEMLRNKYTGALQIDFVEWLAQVESERE